MRLAYASLCAFAVAGCGANDLGAADLSVPRSPGMAVVVTATPPYPSGGLSLVRLSDRSVTPGIDNTLDGDSVVRAVDGEVYVLSRSKGVLRIYDPSSAFSRPVEIVTGDGAIAHDRTDPTDVLPIPATSKLYVAAYATDAAHAVGVIDVMTPSRGVVKWIAVPASTRSSLARPTALWLCGPLVYVLLEDLDSSFDVTGPGRIAVVDPRTDALVSDTSPSVIALVGTNPGGGFPYGMTRYGEGCDDVLVAQAGDLSGRTMDLGGIERVDLTLRRSNGLLLSGATDLGGNVGAIASAGPHLVYAVVGAAENKVVALDPTDKKVLGDVAGPATFVPFVQVSPDHQIFIGVSTSTGGGQIGAGLYIGPADGGKLARAPILLDQPPYGIAFY